ncbi:hypothetical protein EBR56_08915 [bacterium]|nr:hypothetical protein [bacterium]
MEASSSGPPTIPRIRQLVTPGQTRGSDMAALWLPWLAAPLFMAAPIGGCALAERWRPPSAHAADEPRVAIVTAGPVVPVGHR